MHNESESLDLHNGQGQPRLNLLEVGLYKSLLLWYQRCSNLTAAIGYNCYLPSLRAFRYRRRLRWRETMSTVAHSSPTMYEIGDLGPYCLLLSPRTRNAVEAPVGHGSLLQHCPWRFQDPGEWSFRGLDHCRQDWNPSLDQSPFWGLCPKSWLWRMRYLELEVIKSVYPRENTCSLLGNSTHASRERIRQRPSQGLSHSLLYSRVLC